MEHFIVDMQTEKSKKYYFIREEVSQEIVLLPSQYLMHKMRAKGSPNTIKRSALVISYYLNYLSENQLTMEDVWNMKYEKQQEHFTDFLIWLKAGMHSKDIWELEKFEFPIRRNPIKNVKTLNFTDILQPDIREEVKRTIFLHLKYSALGTIHSEMTAVKRFSRFLNVRKPELESLQELSREDIEDYLIYLQTETTERKNYRSDLYGLKRVIEDVGNIYERRHLLQLFLNNDFPSTPRYQFKFYSDATIKRLNSHIFNMDEQIARALIVHQLLGTRISDTLTLRMDCLREKEGRYFVRIDQVKSITYEKAVSNEVGRLILKAMEYTKERYGETEYVFVKKDDPTKPYQYGMIQAQVMRMIRQKDIRDDNGELLKFGTHIFRHCYGKKLTELHIEDWMIARLLGHKTLQSVHHYRRIGNKVMADETRKTREKMDLILMDIIKGWDGYEL